MRQRVKQVRAGPQPEGGMSFGLSAQPSEAPPVDPYLTKVLWGSTTPTLTWECVMGGAEEMGTV